MRAIAACAVAALLTGCALSPDEIRQREPVGKALLKGDERTAKRCLANHLSSRYVPMSLVTFIPLVDEDGVRVQCGGLGGLCIVFETKPASGGTLATAFTSGARNLGVDGRAVEALEACKA